MSQLAAEVRALIDALEKERLSVGARRQVVKVQRALVRATPVRVETLREASEANPDPKGCRAESAAI